MKIGSIIGLPNNKHQKSNKSFDLLESALLDFGNLSLSSNASSSAEFNKSLKQQQGNSNNGSSNLSEKYAEMRPRRRIRYRPYRVPQQLSLSLFRHLLSERRRHSDGHNDGGAAASKSLPARQRIAFVLDKIQLNECDFNGQPLCPSTAKDICKCLPSTAAAAAIPNVKAEHHLDSPNSARYSKYRRASTGAADAKPCWLQHRSSHDGGPVQQQLQPGRRSDLSSSKEEQMAKQYQHQQELMGDEELNELSDYFQHFVCLRAPRMSDQAQSMYA